VKKLPLLSLALLLIAYSTFGLFLTHTTGSRLAWIIVLMFTLFQALLLTTWFDGLRVLFGRWLRSDIGYFTLIVVFSLSVTVALVWFRASGYFLVLISAEILARLDLQNAGFTRVQALIILTLFSVGGLALGWAANFNPMFKEI
jgi:hypothetical protein